MFRMEDSMLNKMQAHQDTEKKGQEIYEQRILPLLEPAEKGKFVAIDTATAEYEIDRLHADAIVRLLQRCPDASICTVRVGYPVPYQPRWPRLRPARDD